MAHVAKHTRAAAGHLCAHYDRSEDNISNENIDRERTPENYNLGPHRDVPQVEFIRQRTSEVQCMKRKDVNVMCSWIVTAPKDFPAADTRRFFDESYSFLTARYGGEKNVISSYVHMDEITPHMHFAFVPVVRDKRKDTEKVSAKECVTQKDLQTFHLDLERYMAQVFGREIGLLNDATKDGNRTVAELKRESAAQAALEASNLAEKALARVGTLESQESALKRKIQGLEEKLQGRTLSVEQIERIPVKISRPTFGGEKEDKVTVAKSDWGNLKKTAIEGATTIEYRKKLGEWQKDLKSREKAVGSREELAASLRDLGKEKEQLRLQLAAMTGNYERAYERVKKLEGRGARQHER